jgi:hypothetical protein
MASNVCNLQNKIDQASQNKTILNFSNLEKSDLYNRIHHPDEKNNFFNTDQLLKHAQDEDYCARKHSLNNLLAVRNGEKTYDQYLEERKPIIISSGAPLSSGSSIFLR